ncbi:hypothetical protein [Chamaesiphon polymorphus]|uniref:Uncharacterized protein n=1 Tax=Chamaesiphon polymorphus CCALA 037 TaxID=2107692 RepID=A0A2T1GJL6_9CYAN|nr:hypothetical protein [Chamaesiphon polymorphus]PSB58004.1 hypothetical protein C7B77_06450 [Chamaesiphon polymorphus CCALA 037]
MLKSYEAIYENGEMKWLLDRPSLVHSARVVVTVLEETLLPTTKRRTFPTELAGTVQILGDIVSPIVAEEDWECLK